MMAAFRTAAQRETSRANGARSLGPVTPAGKRQSARNGTKHGYTAGALPTDDMRAELDVELEIYREKLRPTDEFERELIETAALAQVRINRLNVAIEHVTASNVRHALRDWDEARAAEVEELTERLKTEPLAALQGLRRTAEGCDRLADLWDSLGAALGRWDDDQVRLFNNLLGHAQAPRPDAHPEDFRVAHAAFAVHAHADPAKMAQKQKTSPEAILKNLGPRERYEAQVREHIAARIAEHEALAAELWERYDKPDRDSAPYVALFDDSPEGRRLHRHLADNERLRRRALAELSRLRAEASRALRAAVESATPDPAPAPAQDEPGPGAPATPPAQDEPGPAVPEAPSAPPSPALAAPNSADPAPPEGPPPSN
jgi:hypothetical protein